MKLIRLRDDAILRRVLGRHHGRSRIALRTVLKCPRCKGLFRTTVDREEALVDALEEQFRAARSTR